MSNACTYAPSTGTDLFYALKKRLGYKKAWEVYGIVMGSKFQNDYGDSLSFDTEGVPSFSSVMKSETALDNLNTIIIHFSSSAVNNPLSVINCLAR